MTMMADPRPSHRAMWNATDVETKHGKTRAARIEPITVVVVVVVVVVAPLYARFANGCTSR